MKRRAKKVDGWNIYKDPDREYVKQLNAKFLIEKTDKKGAKKIEWRTRRHGQDHYWDCELYALCLSKVVGLGDITKNEEKKDQTKKPGAGKAGPGKQRSNSGSAQKRSGPSIW